MLPKNKQNTAAAGHESTAPAESLPAQDGFSLISNKKLLQLYATMLKCRLLEERIKAELGQLAPAAEALMPRRGREAAVVGVLMDVLSDDSVTVAPLDLIPMFLSGTSLADLFLTLRQAISQPPQVRPAPYVSATATIANPGKAKKTIGVVVAGDGDEEHPSWVEALQLASAHHLPTIFVFWGPRKAPKLDFPIMTVDACDVVAVYRVASESITHARDGFGPTLIDCQHWDGAGSTRNPLKNMEKYLDRKGLFNKAEKAEITLGFRAELDAAVKLTQSKLPNSTSGI